jgi:glutamate racemase
VNTYGADRIVLGCTHYLFLQPLIEVLVGPGVTVIEPAAAIARQLGLKLGLGQASHHRARLHAYTSAPVLQQAQRLFQQLWHPAAAMPVSILPTTGDAA